LKKYATGTLSEYKAQKKNAYHILIDLIEDESRAKTRRKLRCDYTIRLTRLHRPQHSKSDSRAGMIHELVTIITLSQDDVES
jgi:hypothetical protein